MEGFAADRTIDHLKGECLLLYSPAHEGRQINIIYNLINGLVYSLNQ